jgi:hypothetical protein
MKLMEARSSAKPEKETDSIFCASLLWIRYIELIVHKNIRLKSSEILGLIQDIQQSSFPDDRLTLIKELFIKATANLTHCFERQELIIFPFLRAICQDRARRDLYQRPPFNRIRLQIQNLMPLSDFEEILLDKIIELAKRNSLNEDFGRQFQDLIKRLGEFRLEIKELIEIEAYALSPYTLNLLVKDRPTSTPLESSYES